MDKEVSAFLRTSGNRGLNESEKAAAVFVEGGVKLRQFSPVKLLLESKPLTC